MLEQIEACFVRHANVIESVRMELSASIARCAEEITTVLQSGGKVLIMGNGGSAADAEHFTAELVGRFTRERQAFPAISLASNVSVVTAVANDYGYENVFKRQIEALAFRGDVVVGISTSGRSPNVINGIKAARTLGCKTIGLLGREGGELAEIVDVGLIVSAQSTAHIQEAHGVIIHILCELVEGQLSGVVPVQNGPGEG